MHPRQRELSGLLRPHQVKDAPALPHGGGQLEQVPRPHVAPLRIGMDGVLGA